MTRLEFLKSLGLSGATLFTVLATCTMQSCSSSGSDDPTPNNPTGGGGNASAGVTGTTTGNNIDFTVDLTNMSNSLLSSTGGSQVFGDVIVARTGATTFVALAKACTHQGTTITFRAANNDFFCPNHGSLFNLNGTVARDPATQALKVFTTTLNNNSLRVTA
jgi:cytochrome b6-f complex iron-sulfur subunit